MRSPPARFAGLRTRRIGALEVPVADRFTVRLLGLAGLDREEAGEGLLIPRCRSVHTFGMRFALDLFFLDLQGAEIRRIQAVPPRRLAVGRGASAVLEVPSESVA